MPMRVITQKEMINYLSDQKLVYGIFMGWMIFLGLLNLFLWSSLKDNIHLFYILFIGTTALWVIANWGLSFQYIWPDTPDWASKARPVFSTLSFLFILELASRYFSPDEGKPLYKGFTRVLQSLLLVLLVIFVLGNIALANQLIRTVTLSIADILWFLSILVVLFFIAKNYKHEDYLNIQIDTKQKLQGNLEDHEAGLLVALMAKVAKADGKICELEAELLGHTFTDLSLHFENSVEIREKLKAIYNKEKESFDNTIVLAQNYLRLTKSDYNKRLKFME